MKTAWKLLKWAEQEYSKDDGDPWGLDWRPTQKYRYSLTLKIISKYLNARHPRISDVGCSTGIFSNLLAEYFKELDPTVTAIDLSPVAIERARDKYKSIEFIQSDIGAYSKKNKNRDNLVVCLETLYYIEPGERGQAVEQLLNLLAPDGLLVISSFHGKSPYLTKNEIIRLLDKTDILEFAELHLKPLILLERLLIKLGKVLRLVGFRSGPIRVKFAKQDTLQFIEHSSSLFEKLFGSLATSHYLVIARKIK